MTGPDLGPSTNVEGAPTLVYEVWDWYYSASLVPYWRFIGYRVLSLRQMLKYQDFGYHVERSHRRDRNGTLPLFPRLDSPGPDQGHGVDPVPVP